ncbi:F-box domain-containing protein [Mycena sanguinolenta]|uniref:F-box domain-containing protein n=1 Tax=Mycena sanguinolenta TaxID=230812 RepID=A0A8H6XNT4_9AGAR|nr:F-box domain-containing protein [Mycena sanguinolenta]
MQTPSVTLLSLPNELLALIAAAGQSWSRVRDFLPQATLEWTLSHVSRCLRNVMIGNPALWTVVEADLSLEGSVEIARLYLKRSHNLPLAVTLQHRSELPGISKHERVTKRLSPLVLPINRISWLRIAVHTQRGDDLLLAPFRGLAAPALRHLEVVNLVSNSRTRPIKLFSAGAPRIRFLKMYAQDLQSPMPWTSSLTHLELRQYHGNQSLDKVLAHCPSLVYLYLDMQQAPLNHRVRIPSLQSLYITIPNILNGTPLEIIDVFDTPSLTEFTIMGFHGFDIFELFSSTSLPHASFPSLDSLCFVKNHRWPCYCEYNNISFPETSCTPFYLFPALSSLALIDVCFISHIVKAVAPTSATCPALQTIAISTKTAVEDVRSAVSDTMDSYLQHDQPLPTLRLSPALASCEEWQKNGIAVEKFDPMDVLQVFLVSDSQYA